MKWQQWLDKWGMTGLKINLRFLEMEWKPQDKDRNAAWELYIELLTRITTQELEEQEGDEATALKSVHSLFGLTREIIRRHGRLCNEFTKIAIVVLNQIIRPFTSKWHGLSLDGAFSTAEGCATFREDMALLRDKLKKYTQLLADMAGVEDLTELEDIKEKHRPTASAEIKQ